MEHPETAQVKKSVTEYNGKILMSPRGMAEQSRVGISEKGEIRYKKTTYQIERSAD